MKRTVLILALMITSMVIHAQQTPEQRARLEAKYGIRDIKLGTPISEFSGLLKYKDFKYCGVIYIKLSEYLTIGDLKVLEIKYLFLDDILFGIYIEIRSGVDTEKMKRVLTNLYGKPNYKSNQFLWEAESFKVAINEYVNTSELIYLLNNFDRKCEEIQDRKLQPLKNDL